VLGGAVGTGIAAAVTITAVAADTNTVRERIASITTDGNFNSGWHIHPGPVIVQVQDGYLKITQATCHPNVIGPARRTSRRRECQSSPRGITRRRGRSRRSCRIATQEIPIEFRPQIPADDRPGRPKTAAGFTLAAAHSSTLAAFRSSQASSSRAATSRTLPRRIRRSSGCT
jgi:hypothetical protein